MLFSVIIPVLLSSLMYMYMSADLMGGHVELRGKSFYEDIDIYSLEYGYKVVNAKTFHGAMYGLGFVHARDRLWQLNFLRMLGQGRLSEVRVDFSMKT